MTSPKVFLSYAWSDRRLGKSLAKSLETRGIQTWTSEEDLPAERIEKSLRRELERANYVVLLLSRDAIDAPSVLFEAGAAIAEEKDVIAVFLSSSARQYVPFDLSNIRVIRGQGVGVARLADRIADIVSPNR